MTVRGNGALALEVLSQALRSLPAEAERERALALIEIGVVRWRQGNFEEATQSLGQAVEQAEQAGAHDARADALRHLGTVQVLRGAAADGLESYRQSLALYEQLGDLLGQANVHNNIGIVHRRAGPVCGCAPGE